MGVYGFANMCTCMSAGRSFPLICIEGVVLLFTVENLTPQTQYYYYVDWNKQGNTADGMCMRVCMFTCA